MTVHTVVELRLQMTVKMRYDLSEVVNNSISEWECLFRGRYPWRGGWYTRRNCTQARPSDKRCDLGITAIPGIYLRARVNRWRDFRSGRSRKKCWHSTTSLPRCFCNYWRQYLKYHGVCFATFCGETAWNVSVEYVAPKGGRRQITIS